MGGRGFCVGNALMEYGVWSRVVETGVGFEV